MIGETSLGEFARWQLETIRADPRESRGHGAMLDDFIIAMEEAERIRSLGTWGLYELQQSLEREEGRLGVTRRDDALSDDAKRTLQAAWERSEMARLELERGHPHLNEQALISMNSALDAMVQELRDSRRAFRIRFIAAELMNRAAAQVPEFQMPEEQRGDLMKVVEEEIAAKLPAKVRLKGAGAHRYERALSPEGLGASEDRPIPEGLHNALRELGILRNALVHSAGRLKEKDLERCRTLRYQIGDLIRVSRVDYRRYSAAIRCYGEEIRFRTARQMPGIKDSDGPRLEDWEGYYRVNA